MSIVISLCMFVCMCVCVYVCLYVCVCVCMYVRDCVFYVCVLVCACNMSTNTEMALFGKPIIHLLHKTGTPKRTLQCKFH